MTEQAVLTRRGASRSTDAREAARELYEQICMPDLAFAVVFASPDYDLDVLGAELSSLFGDTPVIGCTSSGEIGPGGYAHGTLVGAGMSSEIVSVVTASFDTLGRFEMSDGADMTARMIRELKAQCPDATPLNTFAMLLIDGLSAREEIVTAAVHPNLHGIPMFGGSASDEYRLQQTSVYYEGTFAPNRFVLAVMHTTHPFRVFRHQHFESTGEPLVVTEADTPQRIIKELNGRPAAEEYARALGVELDPTQPGQFSGHPMIVRVDGEDYLRSPMEWLPDGSLRFACAIAEGLIFTPGRSLGLVPSLEKQVRDIRSELGSPELLIACDCYGRLVEAQGSGAVGRVGDLLDSANAIGLATYGEQINSMHVNQTLTGVALGRSPVSA